MGSKFDIITYDRAITFNSSTSGIFITYSYTMPKKNIISQNGTWINNDGHWMVNDYPPTYFCFWLYFYSPNKLNNKIINYNKYNK
ncbi:hypothetical protein C0Q74_10065 [Klebsiella pneumoniae]|nr:hypothetical protein [Klebsiella pneumoniae]